MKPTRALRSLRAALLFFAAALAVGCTLLDERPKSTIVGASISNKHLHAGHLGTWRGRLLIQAEYKGDQGVFVVDTGADTITAFHPVSGSYYPQFAVMQESLLVHATLEGDELHVIDLGRGTSLSKKLPDSYTDAQLRGSGERLFISLGRTRSAEILDGPRLEDRMPMNSGSVATQGGRVFLANFFLSPRLYYKDAGGPIDSLDLRHILQDTVAGIQQIVAHGGYLFLQMSGQTYPVYKDTAYLAVLNATTLTLEKTMALTFDAYNSSPAHPRVSHDKWYLCGSRDFNPWRFHGVDALDLNTHSLEPLVLHGLNATEGMRDFVALTPHGGYVIERSEVERIRKVTF